MRGSLFLFFWLLSTTLAAQVAKVVDANTKDAIDMVYVFSSSHYALTDLNGEVSLNSFGSEEVLVFQHPGYKSYTASMEELRAEEYYILLEPSVVNINEVVVSVNRFETESEDIPKTVELVTKGAIRFQNPQTSADVLNVSKSVFIQKSQQGGGSPMIRGLSTNRVLLVVDGVRMNNAIFREGNLQNVISLDANSLQQTEIVLGPGAVIYGSDALGGVMNFTTLKPTYSATEDVQWNVNAVTRYSSAAQEKMGHFDLNVGGQKWAWVASATYSDYGDLKMGSYGPSSYRRPEYQDQINGVDTALVNDDDRVQKFSGYSQQNYLSKIGYRPNTNWEFTLSGQYSITSDVPRYDRLLQYRNGNLRFGEWNYGPQQWGMAQFQANHYSAFWFYDAAKLNVAYQNYQESRLSRQFGSPTRREQYEGVDIFSANLDFEKQLSDEIQIYYGLQSVFNNVSSRAQFTEYGQEVPGDPGTRYPDGSTWNTQGIYIDGKYEWAPGWILDGGLRYTIVQATATFDDRFPLDDPKLNETWGALNGMAGLTRVTNSGYRFFLNFSTGFRAPNIDDLGKVFDSEPGQVVVPNPDLKPEYLYGVELGMDKNWNDVFSIEASAFYTFLDDMMVRRPFDVPGVDSVLYDGVWSTLDAIQNAESAQIYGLSVGVNYQITNQWSARAKYNYQTGQTADNENLRHVAPSFGSVGVLFTRGWLKAEMYTDFNGELKFDQLSPSEVDKAYLYASDENGNPYSPNWYTVNLKASIKLNPYLTVMGGVENITDQLYRPYSSGISAPGRNYSLSLRATL
ncbi:MAG: TonB-dependent receptor [Schleiferiaceae bacterium]